MLFSLSLHVCAFAHSRFNAVVKSGICGIAGQYRAQDMVPKRPSLPLMVWRINGLRACLAFLCAGYGWRQPFALICGMVPRWRSARAVAAQARIRRCFGASDAAVPMQGLCSPRHGIGLMQRITRPCGACPYAGTKAYCRHITHQAGLFHTPGGCGGNACTNPRSTPTWCQPIALRPKPAKRRFSYARPCQPRYSTRPVLSSITTYAMPLARCHSNNTIPAAHL